MHAKTGRLNSNFQIAHFLVGSCHTADGAYALLCDLRDERQQAIAAYHVGIKRNTAREMLARRWSFWESTRAERQADLEELLGARAQSQVLYQIALDELAFIELCVSKLQPYRQYGHLSDQLAHQAAQEEEWAQELIRRGENSLLAIGAIPTDQLSAMRLHPQFASKILPALDNVRRLGFAALSCKPDVDIAKLLGGDYERLTKSG